MSPSDRDPPSPVGPSGWPQGTRISVRVGGVARTPTIRPAYTRPTTGPAPAPIVRPLYTRPVAGPPPVAAPSPVAPSRSPAPPPAAPAPAAPPPEASSASPADAPLVAPISREVRTRPGRSWVPLLVSGALGMAGVAGLAAVLSDRPTPVAAPAPPGPMAAEPSAPLDRLTDAELAAATPQAAPKPVRAQRRPPRPREPEALGEIAAAPPPPPDLAEPPPLAAPPLPAAAPPVRAVTPPPVDPEAPLVTRAPADR